MVESEQASTVQVDYVRKRIEGNMNYLDWSAWYNGWWAFGLKIGSAILGAATTVLIGTGKILGQDFYVAAALVTSGVVSVLSTWEAFFGYGDKRLGHNNSAQVMRRLLNEFDYAAASPEGLSKQKLDNLFERFEKAHQDAYSNKGGDDRKSPNH
jgi:hypothetical protein